MLKCGPALMGLSLALGGCASITAGTTQTVLVSTVPTSGANCALANEKGRWVVNPTPGSTTVTKAYGDLTVSCSDPAGDQGATSVKSTTAGAAFGNILVGGIIGAAIDMSSGAAYEYPSNVVVTMVPSKRPAAVAAPAATNAPPPPAPQGTASAPTS